jgi:hypothetical protein
MRNLKVITGQFNGTGAAVYLCVGAIPRKVELVNLEVSTYPIRLYWQREMACEVTCCGGVLVTGGSGGDVSTKTIASSGITPYEGGELLTTSNQTSTSYGEGIYLGWDDADYRADYVYGSGTKFTPINTWTFDGTLSGHFNVSGVASGCRIGVGSLIRIKENSTGLVKEAYITALTSTPTFTTASYVTLSRAIGTGAITFVGGAYQLAPIDIGKRTPAGILVSDTACNVNDNMVVFNMTVDE